MPDNSSSISSILEPELDLDIPAFTENAKLASLETKLKSELKEPDHWLSSYFDVLRPWAEHIGYGSGSIVFIALVLIFLKIFLTRRRHRGRSTREILNERDRLPDTWAMEWANHERRIQ